MSDTAKTTTEAVGAVAILLDSPMQSWGSSSRFTQRESESFPTKSALIGLLAAAAGIDKESPNEAELIAPFSALRLTIYRLPRGGNQLVRRLSDFHTVGGGYDAKASAFDKMSIPRKASGGASANAVITKRTYLTDARFIACLEGNAGTIQTLVTHLENPIWGVWFGRKTCVPAMPLLPSQGADTLAATRVLLERLHDWEKTSGRIKDPFLNLDPLQLESWTEIASGQHQAGDFYLHDQPLSFGSRDYHTRTIRHEARPVS